VERERAPCSGTRVWNQVQDYVCMYTYNKDICKRIRMYSIRMIRLLPPSDTTGAGGLTRHIYMPAPYFYLGNSIPFTERSKTMFGLTRRHIYTCIHAYACTHTHIHNTQLCLHRIRIWGTWSAAKRTSG